MSIHATDLQAIVNQIADAPLGDNDLVGVDVRHGTHPTAQVKIHVRKDDDQRALTIARALPATWHGAVHVAADFNTLDGTLHGFTPSGLIASVIIFGSSSLADAALADGIVTTATDY